VQLIPGGGHHNRWAESKGHIYIDMVLASRGAVAGVDDRDCFRFFDQTTGHVQFWGESFDLLAIVSEVERILPKLAKEAAKAPWEDSARLDATSQGRSLMLRLVTHTDFEVARDGQRFLANSPLPMARRSR